MGTASGFEVPWVSPYWPRAVGLSLGVRGFSISRRRGGCLPPLRSESLRTLGSPAGLSADYFPLVSPSRQATRLISYVLSGTFLSHWARDPISQDLSSCSVAFYTQTAA